MSDSTEAKVMSDWKRGEPPPPGYLVSRKGTLYKAPNPPRQLSPGMMQAMNEICAKVQRDSQEQLLRTIFEKEHLKAIDKWMVAQGDPSIDRAQAIRRLVEVGLSQDVRKRARA